MSGPEDGTPPPRRETPRLEVLSPTKLALVAPNGARLELEGGNVARAIAWHTHMLEAHGPAWAATYLAGFVDGLGHQAARDLERAVEDVRAHVAEGRALREQAEELLRRPLPGRRLDS